MKRILIFVVFVISAVISVFLMNNVNVNYDLSKYLPDSSESAEAIGVYEDVYGTSSQADLMISIGDYSVDQLIAVEQLLENVDGVQSVSFLDDQLNQSFYQMIRLQADALTGVYLDQLETATISAGGSYASLLMGLYASNPAQMSDIGAIINQFWHESSGEALMNISFSDTSASDVTQNALEDVKTILDNGNIDYRMAGGAVSTAFTRATIVNEVSKITWIIIPLILLVLLWMTPSFFDLVLFIVTAGIAILINLGTNSFLPSISFITQSMAIVLQLAISLDYMIFVVHRYHRELDKGLSAEDALAQTKKRIISPVLASALTTGVSFLALVFMRFSIGLDIGIVFFKAVSISLLCSIFLLPELIKTFSKSIEKTKHKTFSLRFGKMAKLIYKARYVFLGLLLLLIVPVTLMQSNNDFIYGDSAISASEGTTYYNDELAISDEFGRHNQIVVMGSADDAVEAQLIQSLLTSDLPITNIQAGILIKQSVSDPTTLAVILPQFYQDSWTRIILTLDLPPESDETENSVNELKLLVSDAGFDSSYLLGSSVVAYDIKDVIRVDYRLVSIIALVGVMTIVFLTFKNLLLPIILPLVIVTSVFLTMSIPFLAGQTLVFLAYLIVSTILLGATIDYAILLSKTYLELRVSRPKAEAIHYAIESSAPSIFTSAVIYIIAGVTVFLTSSILTISQIGLVIAIGATVSMLFVLVMLPQLLFILDKFIVKANIDNFKS